MADDPTAWGAIADPNAAGAAAPPSGGDDPTKWGAREGPAAAAPDADAVAKMSTGERFARGFGHQVMDWVRGGEQLLATPGTPSEADRPAVEARYKAATEKVEQSRRENAALMSTTAGKVGSMAAGAVPFFAAPEGYLAAAGVGAAEGLLTPTKEGESRAWNVGTGAAAGAAGTALGRVAGRVIQPWEPKFTAARDAAVGLLKRAGIDLDVEQQVGGKFAQTVKIAAADNPILARSEKPMQQLQQYTRAVLRTMGVDSEEATTNVMQRGRKALKDNYDDIAARTHIQVDPVMDRALYDIQWQAQRSLTKEDANVIRKQIKNIFDGVRTGVAPGRGVILGDRYAAINQALDRVPGEGGKAPFVTAIRRELTDALRRSATPEDRQLLALTDQRYGAMKQIERAIGEHNLISPALLYNATDTLARTNQSVYGSGANQELVQLAQAGKLVFGNLVPQSGTPRRAAAMALFGVGGAAADRRLRGNTSAPETFLAGAAASALGPAALRAIIENPKVANAVRQWAESQGASRAAGVTRRWAAPAAAGAATGAVLSDVNSDIP